MGTGMTNQEFAKAVNHGRQSRMVALLVVVYEHPEDFPESYVARVYFVNKGRSWPSQEIFIVKDTLDEVRAAIPPGMFRMKRSSEDDPCIVETYL